MTATLTKQSSPQQKAREVFKQKFNEGIRPVDDRLPISDELAVAMIQELDIPKDALIGVIDAFLILSTHLKEAGYTNLVLLESSHQNLTSSQEKYYNSVRETCKNSGIEYCNNWKECDMKFDVVIGNPPYQSGDKIGRGGSKKLWKEFLEIAISNSDYVSLIVPPTVLAPSTFGDINKRVSLISFNINHHFPGVGSDFCRLVIHGNDVETTRVETREGTFVEFPAGTRPFLPSKYNDRYVELERKLLGTGRVWKQGLDPRSIKYSTIGQHKLIHSAENTYYTNKEHPQVGTYRVHMRFTGKPNFQVTFDDIVSSIHWYTTFDTYEDAQEYADKLNTAEVCEFLTLSKYSGMTYKQTLESLEV
jgi:hypothetical protein